jgi:hypothetical protein
MRDRFDLIISRGQNRIYISKAFDTATFEAD